MIVAINPVNFIKCQKSIEHGNLTTPSKKILVMDKGLIDSKSHLSGLLLRAYYAKLEHNPNLGISFADMNLVIHNTKNENDEIECFYCKQMIHASVITIDHFKPKVFKGANQYFNIKLACKKCNVTKGGIYPQKMPVTFNHFLEKIKTGNPITSLKILQEVKKEMIVDETESELIDRLISMELHWREESGTKKMSKNISEYCEVG
jgi:hypothetical protein